MKSPKLNTVSYDEVTFDLGNGEFDRFPDDIMNRFLWDEFKGMTTISEAIDRAARKAVCEMCYADKWDMMTILDSKMVNYYVKLRFSDYEQNYAESLEHAIADVIRDAYEKHIRDLALFAAAYHAFGEVGKDTISQAAWEAIYNIVILCGEESLTDCTAISLHDMISPVIALEKCISE